MAASSDAEGLLPDLPLIEGDDVVKLDPDQSQLTTMYTERAVQLHRAESRARRSSSTSPTPCRTCRCSSRTSSRDKTGQGLYGDVIAEIDWSVGQILDAVKRADLDDNTLVIFTSDNGPWMSYGNHAGSPGPFRESKGTSFEGGVARAVRRALAGPHPARARSRALPAMTIDLLPTVARPRRRVRARRSHHRRPRHLAALVERARRRAPHEALYFYWGTELHAVRSGQWKLHLPHPYQSLERLGADGAPGEYVRKEIELSLFDLDDGSRRDDQRRGRATRTS